MPSMTDCPECRYPLKGLPEKHACPECGLRYDEHSVVRRAKVPFAFYGGFLGFLGGLPGVVQVYWILRLELAVFISVLFAAILATVGLIVLRFVRRGSMAAAMTDGLHLRVQRLPQRVVPWSSISHAIASPKSLYRGLPYFRFGVTIFLKSERRTHDVLGVFKNEEEASAFAGTINHYVNAQSDESTA